MFKLREAPPDISKRGQQSSDAKHKSSTLSSILGYLQKLRDLAHWYIPNFIPNKMPADGEDRAALVNRQLPEMTLSTADNPLTAPRPPPEDLSIAQRAQYRFQVKGNAIST